MIETKQPAVIDVSDDSDTAPIDVSPLPAKRQTKDTDEDANQQQLVKWEEPRASEPRAAGSAEQVPEQPPFMLENIFTTEPGRTVWKARAAGSAKTKQEQAYDYDVVFTTESGRSVFKKIPMYD